VCGPSVCTPELAPRCTCDDGYFGVACGIAPRRLPLLSADPDLAAAEAEAEADVAAEATAAGMTPEEMQAMQEVISDPADAPLTASASGYLPEGHFVYYFVDVPASARSLSVTLSHPLHQRSFPRMFLKRDTIPVYCASVSGRESDSSTHQSDLSRFRRCNPATIQCIPQRLFTFNELIRGRNTEQKVVAVS